MKMAPDNLSGVSGTAIIDRWKKVLPGSGSEGKMVSIAEPSADEAKDLGAKRIW